MPAPSSRKSGQVPLERALSKRGIASRTQAHQLIIQGKVKVNGMLRINPQFMVNPDKARFEIEGQEVAIASTLRTFLLHKPRGTITTRSDEKGRKTVFELLQNEPGLNLHAVGRLDWATSGLLILTNDTRLSSWLTDPVNEVPRVYLVSVRGEINSDALESIRAEVSQATLRKTSGRESHLTLELRQGKNREIRKLMEAHGHEVTKLKRVAYGGLELGEIPPGNYRELDHNELISAFPTAPIRSRNTP